MYQARVLELKELILAEEARFKFVPFRHRILLPFYAHLVFSSVAAEIEAIRAGRWDTKLEIVLGIVEDSPDRPAYSPQSEVGLLFGLNLRSFSHRFVASQRDRGLRVRPHRRIRHELICPSDAGSYIRVMLYYHSLPD